MFFSSIQYATPKSSVAFSKIAHKVIEHHEVETFQIQLVTENGKQAQRSSILALSFTSTLPYSAIPDKTSSLILFK